MIDTAELMAQFTDRFGGAPQIFRAPGRVNLIGEHTDYNDGFVLPAAIDLATYAACGKRRDKRVVLHSLALDETYEFDIDDLGASPRRAWTDYVQGVALALRASGRTLDGANVLVQGDLPMGAGLSASAALEVVIGFALCRLAASAIERTDLARLCQFAENNFVGARCGVMDQLISCCGVAGHALLIDCRTLAMRPVSIPPEAGIVICNTMVSHALATSAYNRRREECERAVEILSERLAGVSALRDVGPEMLSRHAAELPDDILRRARHVVTENARTIAAAEALKAGDLARVGKLMNDSHASLRDDYEVSCPEADVMTALAQSRAGVFGARMTGGGFGGCTVNLVARPAIDEFIDFIVAAYRQETGLTPQVFCCTPSDGVDLVPLA